MTVLLAFRFLKGVIVWSVNDELEREQVFLRRRDKRGKDSSDGNS